MSGWSEARILIIFLASLLSTVVPGETEKLSVCGPTTDENYSPSLAFVSTLDGKVTALDIGNGGERRWIVDIGEGPMLASNIHWRELNNDGHWVRLIPSLNGGLYKFDGDNLEPLPITADQLLRSSFRYSDDLVFSGGKETHSYGISTLTGQILYRCNISGCTNKTEGDPFQRENVLVVQRFQQTVRAVEPRTGLEKWNYSVGQHDLMLMPQQNQNCNVKTRQISQDIDLRVIVPEGLVLAVSKSNPRIKLWEHKFDSPIVAVWRDDVKDPEVNDATLQQVDLFDGSHWMWGSGFPTSPGIYVGMHDRQIYVQENMDLTKMIEHSRQRSKGSMKFPWRPYPAVENAMTVTTDRMNHESGDTAIEKSRKIAESPSTTALSVLYNSKYINGHGFYLYTKFDSSSQCNGTDPNVINIDGIGPSNYVYEYIDNGDTPFNIVIVSFWNLWKEFIAASIGALAINFLLRCFSYDRTQTKDSGFLPIIVETHVEVKNESMNNTEMENVSDFKSRYQSDFEHIDCLGKGGYGVVFEAKNKIDDCNYAIKRICLPSCHDSRERVMREVKALAKLEHRNIVRYFNAWLECPPIGWQEKQDKSYLADRLSPSGSPSEYTESEIKASNGSIFIDVPPSDDPSIDSAFEAIELNKKHKYDEKSNDTDEEDDSFIVFEGSGRKETTDDSKDENFCSSDSDDDAKDPTKLNPEDGNFNGGERRSESIVFCESTDDASSEKNNERIRACSEKNEKRKRVRSSLKLNEKMPVRKSAKTYLYIQMQLCQKLSLKEWLKCQRESRDVERVVNIFQQIVEAVEYVHLRGLIHRDLKPSNIFFAYDEKIKIGDFGLVTAMTEGCNESELPITPNKPKHSDRASSSNHHTAYVGTHLYMSPEQMNGQSYNYKVDIYSLGIILFELLIPFFTEMERVDALVNLRKFIFPNGFADKYPNEYKLLKIMLDENPTRRPTALGLKARPPLSNNENGNENGTSAASEINKWHLESSQMSQHSSSMIGDSLDKEEPVR